MLGSRTARFVVIDDHELVRDGLVQRLRTAFPGSTVVHAGDSVAAGVEAARQHGCDCAVLDLDLGDNSTVTEIVSAFAVQGIPVLVVSAMATPSALNAALTAGASGYVTKRSSANDLEAAVRAVLDGRSWVAPDLAGIALRSGTQVDLSPQERRALALYASGMTIDMVARRMEIASSTAKHYIDRVRDKYEDAGVAARTKVELNALARKEGLIP